jgi:hypothetical protein
MPLPFDTFTCPVTGTKRNNFDFALKFINWLVSCDEATKFGVIINIIYLEHRSANVHPEKFNFAPKYPN